MRLFCRAVALLPLVALLGVAQGPTWPEFLGPASNGISPEKGLNLGWKTKPPRTLWKVPGGGGFASLAIVGDRVVTAIQRDEKTGVVCLDAATGKELWFHAVASAYLDHQRHGPAPRATPPASERIPHPLLPTLHTHLPMEQECMNAVDGDRVAYLGAGPTYVARLEELAPASCSPRNNLIVGHPVEPGLRPPTVDVQEHAAGDGAELVERHLDVPAPPDVVRRDAHRLVGAGRPSRGDDEAVAVRRRRAPKPGFRQRQFDSIRRGADLGEKRDGYVRDQIPLHRRFQRAHRSNRDRHRHDRRSREGDRLCYDQLRGAICHPRR